MNFICARENIYKRSDVERSINFLTSYFNDAKELMGDLDINFDAVESALHMIKEDELDETHYFIVADFIVNSLNESLHYLRGRAFEEILTKYDAKFEKGVRWSLMNTKDKRERLT